MKENRKKLAIAIMILIVGVSIIPSTGCNVVEKTPVSKSDDASHMENFYDPTIISIYPSSQIVKQA